eukprot:TRINITY_DN6921_c0_g1_i1.p1 TRINITY_DN6921_c0_g1~~TRINITY_DN6921_c0_g1_i1.p1  ORF type:complete len:141 (-),score=3.76 TRINITY_DN6921_c0_g1_i1:33-455(-)
MSSLSLKRTLLIVCSVILLFIGAGIIFRGTYWHNENTKVNYAGLAIGILIILMGLFGAIGAHKNRYGYLKWFFFGCIFWLVIIICQIFISAFKVNDVCEWMIGGCSPTVYDWSYSGVFILFLVLCAVLAKSLKSRSFFKM